MNFQLLPTSAAFFFSQYISALNGLLLFKFIHHTTQHTAMTIELSMPIALSSSGSSASHSFFSTTSESRSSGSASPSSSICSFGEDEHFEELQRQTQGCKSIAFFPISVLVTRARLLIYHCFALLCCCQWYSVC